MKRVRLLYLITELRAAGAERILYQLATGLPSERYEVRVVSLESPHGDGEVAAWLQRAGIGVTLLRMTKADPRGALRLAFVLRSFRPHLIHAHLFHGNLAGRLLGWLSPRASLISTHHVVERRPLQLRRAIDRASAWRDDVTVCVSEAVASYARTQLGVRPGRVRVIPNGIDLRRFAPPADPAAARRAARERLGLPQAATLLGAVGRLDEQKACLDLLAAFDRLAPLHPDLVLVFAGRGPLEAELRQRAAAHGERVRLLGFQEDVPAVLDALDVFALPSLWEGFGLSVAEALARGKPVVVSAVDSLPEVVGQAGLLVPPARPARLAEAVDELLRSPAARAELAARAPAQAARFSLEGMRAAYLELYEELLTRRR